MELETGTHPLEWRDAAQVQLLRAWLDAQVLPAFAGRILPVAIATARRCTFPIAATIATG